MITKDDIYRGIDLLVEKVSTLPTREEIENMNIEELAKNLDKLDQLENSYKILKKKLVEVD